MGFQVSPGVNVTEVDLTTIVPAVSTTDGAFVGVFRWGPIEDITLVGDENQLVKDFGKPDADTAVSFFTAANFLAYGNKLRLVRVADTLTRKVVEFTVSTAEAANGDPVLNKLVTSGLKTGELKVRAGDIVDFGGEELPIASVESDTELTLDGFLQTALVDEVVTIKIYAGALNATAEDITGSGVPGIGMLVKNDTQYQENFSMGGADCGPFMAKYPGELGNSLIVSLCPGTLAYKNSSLTGTVSSSLSNVTVTGVGTKFQDELVPGSIIKDAVTGQERKVVSISSQTSLTINSPFSPSLSGASVSSKWEFADFVGIKPDTSNVAADAGAQDDEMHLVVVDYDGRVSGTKGTVLERHTFMSKAVDGKTDDGGSSYYVNVINSKSKYIRWTDHLIGTENTWGKRAIDVDVFDSPLKPYTVKLSGGRDANNKSVNPAVDAGLIAGYDLFRNPELVDISLVMLGDAELNVVVHVINNICESRKDCIAFVSPPREAVLDNAGGETEATIAFRDLLPSTSYAVMDSGWKYQYDKYNDVYRWLPLNGDIAGLCVRTDIEQDPWWSPAGYNRGNIKNVIKLAYSPFKAERDDLYQKGINPVISQQGQGTVLFGDKTLLAKPSAFDRINVRRLFIVLEKAIARAARFMLFEFNDEFTRQQFRSLVEPFLRDVQSRRGIYDFRVVCDKTNNTGEVIDRNEFVGEIYIKPARSINFIQLKFVAVRTGVEFSEVVGRA